MNKIKIVGDIVEKLDITRKVSFDFKPSKSEFDISSIDIVCFKKCDLELEIESTLKKWRVNIKVQEGIEVNLYLFQSLDNSKIQYNYEICENSKLCVFKFQKVPVGKEMISAHLHGKEAKFDYCLKDLCTGKETFDYYIYHDDRNTSSNIKNNIVSIKGGKVTVQVSTFIPKGMKESTANQNNRIISMNDKKNEIRPNLYIDEYDVVANHSALIGKFSGEEMFYLRSRGISKEQASKLLLNGFLLSDITNKKMKKRIELTLNEEWR